MRGRGGAPDGGRARLREPTPAWGALARAAPPEGREATAGADSWRSSLAQGAVLCSIEPTYRLLRDRASISGRDQGVQRPRPYGLRQASVGRDAHNARIRLREGDGRGEQTVAIAGAAVRAFRAAVTISLARSVEACWSGTVSASSVQS